MRTTEGGPADPELAALVAAWPTLPGEVLQDRIGLLSQKRQAGFANLEQALADRFDGLFETLGGWFATLDATLDAILAELRQFRDANQVATKPESPLRVSVTTEAELQRLKKLRDRLRPPLVFSTTFFRPLFVLRYRVTATRLASRFNPAAKSDALACHAHDPFDGAVNTSLPSRIPFHSFTM